MTQMGWGMGGAVRPFAVLYQSFFYIQGMNPLDATGTPETEQSYPWKERILFWMGHIGLERTPLQSVPRLQWEEATACLQFNMVAGVQPVLQQGRRSTSMERLQLVDPMAKADHGLIKFMLSKVSVWYLKLCFSNCRLYCYGKLWKGIYSQKFQQKTSSNPQSLLQEISALIF